MRHWSCWCICGISQKAVKWPHPSFVDVELEAGRYCIEGVQVWKECVNLRPAVHLHDIMFATVNIAPKMFCLFGGLLLQYHERPLGNLVNKVRSFRFIQHQFQTSPHIVTACRKELLFSTLAWEPFPRERASRWSLAISVLWNVPWTCWPLRPCRRHTLQSPVCCHGTQTHIDTLE